MIAEYTHMVNEMKRKIIPVGQGGLNEVLEKTVHIKLSMRGSAMIEYYANGELVRKPGPKVLSTMTKQDFEEATKRWIHRELLPMVETWTTENSKDMLPSSMAALSVLIGLDVEKFIVTTERGACNICQGKKNCGSADHVMWHIKAGSGVVLITFEGLSPNEIVKPASPRPNFEVPRNARIIAPSGCEAQNNWAIPATVGCLVNIFLSEETSYALASAFGADAAERTEINKFLGIIGLREVGIRITESSAFCEGSVANATLQLYQNSQGGVPKNSLNTQADWVFERTIPMELWAEVGAQEDFSLKKVKNVGRTEAEKFQNRLQRMAFLYHYLDNQMPVFLVQIALVKFFVSHPLVLLMGNNIYAQEVTDVVVEMLGRVCVQGGVWYHAPEAHLPETIKDVFRVLDSVHNLGFEERRLAYRNGGYHFFKVNRKNMPGKKEMIWSTSWLRAGDKTKPETASGTGKKRKTDGFQPLQEGEVLVDGGGGCRIRMDKRVAQGGAGLSSLDDYDVVDKSCDGVGFQMGRDSVGGQTADHVSGTGVYNDDDGLEDVSDDDVFESNVSDEKTCSEGVKISEKRRGEPNLDVVAPAKKKFGAAKDNEDSPRVGGKLNNDKLELMETMFPEMKALIKMVVETDEMTAGDFEVIYEDLQKKITAIQTETHIRKLSGLNDPQAARHDREMAELKRKVAGLKRRTDDRNKEIKKLQSEQTLDNNTIKERKLLIQARESAEEFRRKQYVKQGREKLDERQKNAVEAAQMLVDAMLAKMKKPTPSSTTAKTTTTIVRTLGRIEGTPSAEPAHRYLETWTHQIPYDISRSQVINTSAVINLVMETTVFQEALAVFNAEKDHESIGSLSGVGTALGDIRRATPNGNASWNLCHARMRLLTLMKQAYEDTQDSRKKKIMWTDTQIANAKPHGEDSRAKKIADNREARGQNLVTRLAIAFNQGVVEITGGNLCTTVVWYDSPAFQEEYRGWFDEGLSIMSGAAREQDGNVEYASNHKRAKAAMEALMAQRQKPPVKAEDCEVINKCFEALHNRVTGVEVREEELEDDDVQMSAAEDPEEIERDDVEMDAAEEDVQEPFADKIIVEVEEEERGHRVQRGPAHLRQYRNRE